MLGPLPYHFFNESMNESYDNDIIYDCTYFPTDLQFAKVI